jgi:hypothetical protein
VYQNIFSKNNAFLRGYPVYHQTPLDTLRLGTPVFYWLRSRVVALLLYYVLHRGLKLDGAIGQGEICNSLKSEKFSKSFLSHIGKNRIKF